MWSAIRSDLMDFVSTIKEDTTKTLHKVLGEEDEEDEEVTLRQKLIADTKRSFSTYGTPIEEQYHSQYEKFYRNFSLAAHGGAIAELLDAELDVSRYYAELVPIQIKPEEFWSRYFFRLMLVEKGSSLNLDEEDDDEELVWDSGDREHSSGGKHGGDHDEDGGRAGAHGDGIGNSGNNSGGVSGGAGGAVAKGAHNTSETKENSQLKKKVGSLEDENDRLKRQVKALASRVAELEKLLSGKDTIPSPMHTGGAPTSAGAGITGGDFAVSSSGSSGISSPASVVRVEGVGGAVTGAAGGNAGAGGSMSVTFGAGAGAGAGAGVTPPQSPPPTNTSAPTSAMRRSSTLSTGTAGGSASPRVFTAVVTSSGLSTGTGTGAGVGAGAGAGAGGSGEESSGNYFMSMAPRPGHRVGIAPSAVLLGSDTTGTNMGTRVSGYTSIAGDTANTGSVSPLTEVTDAMFRRHKKTSMNADVMQRGQGQGQGHADSAFSDNVSVCTSEQEHTHMTAANVADIQSVTTEGSVVLVTGASTGSGGGGEGGGGGYYGGASETSSMIAIADNVTESTDTTVPATNLLTSFDVAASGSVVSGADAGPSIKVREAKATSTAAAAASAPSAYPISGTSSSQDGAGQTKGTKAAAGTASRQGSSHSVDMSVLSTSSSVEKKTTATATTAATANNTRQNTKLATLDDDDDEDDGWN